MSRSFPDRFGVPVQARTQAGPALLDEAIEGLAALAGDPVAAVEAAVAADDTLAPGHIYRAYLSLYDTTAEGVAAAAGILEQLTEAYESLAERESLHLRAARAENADYRQAETRARAALGHNPRDVWAVHALAHVFEMEGSQRDGVAFLTASAGDWAGSYFAVHNWWHRGLYHLELGEIDQALGLYDDRIRAGRSTQWLDVVDAAALLWRLSLTGADVTGRARQLAADIDALVDEPVYIFNDWHAVMAFGLAGDHRRAERVLAANRHLTAETNRIAAGRAGLALLEGFGSFAAGHPERTVELLIGIRPEAHVVGGSHAQRDVIDLTLIAAAARAGQARLARALVSERAVRKPAAEAAARQLLEANSR